MSNKKKGDRTKRKAKRYYERQGWTVDDCEKSSKYEKNRDLFNLFDLIAIKGRKVKFIQVKTNQIPKRIKYVGWATEHCNESIICESFNWYDYDGPRIQTYKENGTIIEMDLRKSKTDGRKLYKRRLVRSEFEELREQVYEIPEEQMARDFKSAVKSDN